MTMNDLSYEEQSRRLLSEAKSELNSIREKIHELQARETIINNEVYAYEIALKGYLKRIGKQNVIENDWKNILDKATTHKERIKLIANQQGGKIRVSQITDILYSNGLIKSKKRVTAYSIVQVILSEMMKKGEVEKIGPGEYRLMGTQQSLIQ